MRRKKEHLVCQHLEKISRKALENFKDILEKSLRRRHGIYALYRKNQLYYVGLASDLSGRLNHHLKDRHAKSWDRFSVYLTIQSDHIRELEALAIRISSPKENRQKGKLRKSQNLKKLLCNSVRRRHREEIDELFAENKRDEIYVEGVNDFLHGRKLVLAGYFSKGQKIQWTYKGKTYRAYVKRNGVIRFQKKVFTSPSSAASLITKRMMNGWYCWKYERAPGDWVFLNELRK